MANRSRFRKSALALCLAVCAGASAKGDFSYGELLERIGAASGIEALVESLPENVRSNAALVYKSRAAHPEAVDELHPRVILFTPSAKVVMAFTGDGILEVIRFDEEQEKFALSVFNLAKHERTENPPQCVRCHGGDPRPIYESYPNWPGFYGSVRDSFPADSPERAAFRAFNASRSGVYRLIRYAEPMAYDRTHVTAPPSALKGFPNTRLGMGLTEWNRKRVQRKIRASLYYDQFKYPLVSFLLGCDKTEGENTDKIQRLAEVLRVSRADWSMAMERGSLDFFDGILSGIHEGKSYYLIEDFILEMMRDLALDDPALARYFQTYSAFPGDAPFGERLAIGTALTACGELAKRGGKLPKSRADETQLASMGLPLGRCVTCHRGVRATGAGHKFPFRAPADGLSDGQRRDIENYVSSPFAGIPIRR